MLRPSITTTLKEKIYLKTNKIRIKPHSWTLLFSAVHFLVVPFMKSGQYVQISHWKKLLLGYILVLKKQFSLSVKCSSRNLQKQKTVNHKTFEEKWSFIYSHSVQKRFKLNFQIQFTILLLLNQKLDFIPLMQLKCIGV